MVADSLLSMAEIWSEVLRFTLRTALYEKRSHYEKCIQKEF